MRILLNMRYNLRGQLTSINNSTRTNDGITNDETNDVFGIEILYDKQESTGLSNSQYYTGMISAVKWSAQSPANTDERSFKYNYDKLYRLSASQYQAKATNGTWTKHVDGFNESLTYDENGNIMSLLRKAVLANTVTTIDNLSYSYKNSDYNNQLENITDAITTNTTGYGYRNFAGTSSSTPYSHDDNGNLTVDLKKGTAISYNELNKPTMIRVSSTKKIEYRYDAAGTRISKTVTDNSSVKYIEYIGGYVIENGILSYYSMAEGRVRNEGNGFGLVLKMEYFITDHQGNTRVSFEDDGTSTNTAKLTQENSYYAFGMQMAGGYTPTNPNKKLYNAGSEWQDDIDGLADYYSTFFREYDPIIGRFNSVDPMAEATNEMTTYAYANNNPIMMNDPMGDLSRAEFYSVVNTLFNSMHGGSWSASAGYTYFSSEDEALGFGTAYMSQRSGGGGGGSRESGGATGGRSMSEFDFYSSYAGLKMRLDGYGNGIKYGKNKWGDFGFWTSGWEDGDAAGHGKLSEVKSWSYFTPLNNSFEGFQRNFPAFSDLVKNYPKDRNGEHQHPSSDRGMTNQCAIRVGFTFIKSGIKMSNYKTGPITSEGYPRGAKSLADWIWINYGRPKIMSLADFQKDYSDQTGIIFEFANEGYTDHIDLWNKGKTYSGFYTVSYKEIWFWPVK
ncbi:MAG TPA: T6SS effector amidase Tae4 family protein [Ferruginibacter sp.]|nr:T6SS effector amidase Tae4 family protein [Ferruginibacter sp.]